MRIFEHPNMHGDWVCPICKTKKDKPVVLIGKDGTQRDHIIEAVQTHIECLDLLIRDMPSGKEMLIYQITVKGI